MNLKYLLFFAIAISICRSQDFDADVIETKEAKYEVETFSYGYEIPWGMAFLPSGEMLVLIETVRFIEFQRMERVRMKS